MAARSGCGGRLRGPAVLEPPDGGWSAPQIHLIEAQDLLLMLLDVLPDDGFVSPYRGDEVSPRVPPHKIAFPLAIDASKVNRTLALDEILSPARPHTSAVSPDCDTKIARSPAASGTSRYRNSEAISTLTGGRAKRSNQKRAALPA